MAKKPDAEWTPIQKAVEPQRKAAVQHARDNAQSVVDKVHQDLADHDWDLHKAAPRPHWSKQHSYQGQKDLLKHQLYKNLTSHDTERNRATGNIGSMRDTNHYVKKIGSYRSSSTGKMVYNDNGKKYVDDAEAQAHAGYDAFIYKLHDKVGEHTAAELTGNHVWGHSILHITHKDGSKQKWKTQQIFKLSKLGKPHNQWPTRKIK